MQRGDRNGDSGRIARSTPASIWTPKPWGGKANWNQPSIRFIEDDFLGKVYGQFDSVVSLDVIEHISIERENEFFETLVNNLSDTGIAVVGTPNQTRRYALSPAARHINLIRRIDFAERWNDSFHGLSVRDERRDRMLDLSRWPILVGGRMQSRGRA
jgi:hypothetical protein